MKDEYVKKEDAINALEEKEHEPWYLHKDLEWISGVVEAKDEIKALEPVDVAPVVHGKWINEYWHGETVRKCSVCKITQTVIVYTVTAHINAVKFNYCPYCGAKMDEEE